LPATEALSWGLVTAVYPADDFEAEVDKVIDRLLAGPVVAFAKTKHAINAATLTELDVALEREFEGQSRLLVSHDLKEGTAAFQERRAPSFTDR
jgi:enoyl-CoA hydratase